MLKLLARSILAAAAIAALTVAVEFKAGQPSPGLDRQALAVKVKRGAEQAEWQKNREALSAMVKRGYEPIRTGAVE